MIDIKPDLYPDLAKIINTSYTDKIDRIEAARIDDEDNIIAVAKDGLKRLLVKIDNGGSISIKRADAMAKQGQFAKEDDDLEEKLAATFRASGDKAITNWLGVIQNLIDSSESLEEIKEGLFQLYPSLEDGDFQSTAFNTMTAESMNGYLEAAGEM